MNGLLIKNVVEERVEVSENEFKNKVEITFDSPEKELTASNTITLSGNGSIKVLIPV